VGWLYYEDVQAQKLANTDISNPAARGARAAATTSGSYLRKVPLVGGLLDSMLNDPVTNVTSGNVTSTLESIGSGGVTDQGISATTVATGGLNKVWGGIKSIL